MHYFLFIFAPKAFSECYKPYNYLKSMTVIVNDSKIRIFKGAKVGDAVLRWAVRNRFDISQVSSLQVTDQWGHLLDNAAPLKDQQSINILNQ